MREAYVASAYDDPLVIEQLRAFHGLRDLIVLPDAVPRFYYRPFVFLTFLFDRSLGGTRGHALVRR